MPDQPQALDDLPGPDREFAEAVGGLRLAPMRTTAQQVWFQAGFEAGRRRVVAWRLAAIVAVALSGSSLVWQGINGRGVDRVPADRREVRAPKPASEPASSRWVAQTQIDVTLPDQSAAVQGPIEAPYLVLRNAVAKDGWNALPRRESGGLKGFVPKDWPPEQAGMQSGPL
jgi:hypothetical protein